MDRSRSGRGRRGIGRRIIKQRFTHDVLRIIIGILNPFTEVTTAAFALTTRSGQTEIITRNGQKWNNQHQKCAKHENELFANEIQSRRDADLVTARIARRADVDKGGEKGNQRGSRTGFNKNQINNLVKEGENDYHAVTFRIREEEVQTEKKPTEK
jgi:hypothetical protein